MIDGVPQKGERCIFDVEDNPRAGIFSLDHQRRIHPAHSEEGCFRLLRLTDRRLPNRGER